MLISELSARTGASPRSLRHYEELGLISAQRGANGYRRYDDAVIEVVRTIRVMFDLNLPASLVRSVLPCATGDHEAVDRHALYDTVRDVKDRLGAQIADLTRTHAALEMFLDTPGSAPDDPGFLAELARANEGLSSLSR
jgi:DNA-binding transcriptional MerR regulator